MSQTPQPRSALPGPRGWPLVGNALQLDVDHLHLQLEDWARTYGPMYRYDLGPIPFVVSSDPEVNNEVLRQRPGTYRRIHTFEPIFEELGIAGVFSADGERWRPQRKLALAALNPRHLRAFFPTLKMVTENLKQRWTRAADSGAVVDLQDDFMRFTVDITTHLAFNQPTNTLGDEESEILENIAPVLPLIAQRSNSPFAYWRYLKLPADRRVDRCLDTLRSWLSKVIDRTRAELEADPERAENPTTFLEAMLVEKDDAGNPFSEADIFGNALTMLVAGEDTTANTLAWAVHLLLDHPEELSPVLEELEQVLGDDPVPAEMKTGDKLEAITRVANETMRLKAVAPVLFLEANEQVVLRDTTIEGGTAVCLLTRLPGLDPAHVEDPEVFRPARWTDSALATRLQKAGVFVPFGSGPRICPGRRLSLLEIRMALSTLYQSFEVERVGESDAVDEIFGFTVAPEGLRVKLKHRERPAS